MEKYVSNMPTWAIVLFVISFVYSISFITRAAKQAALNAGMSQEKARNIQFGVYIFYILWLAYASVLALNGAFVANTLPPRVMIYTAFPLMIFLFGFIGNTGLYKKLLRAATLESLIRIHIFRLVGIFFIIIYFYHLLPSHFAFSADMGDVLTALFSIPVANAVAQKKSWATKAVFAWNILGIMDILVLLFMATKIAIEQSTTGPNGELAEMAFFPFSWFPAFAPATILFLHLGVFKKLRQVKAE